MPGRSRPKVPPAWAPRPVHQPHSARRWAEGVGAIALGGLLLLLGLPRVAGASWSQIGDALSGLTVLDVAVLAAVWLAGLWVQTIALSAALPGLSHRRSFFLNVTGSAVSNLLPLGGAAGSAVNYWAVRTWGFSTSAFLRWAVVTNIWDVLGRLAIPGVAILWLSADGARSSAMRDLALGASATLLLALVLTVAALRTEAWARTVGRLADRVGRRVGRPPPPGTTYAAVAVSAQRSVSALVGSAWRRLTVGKAGYAVLQAALLWLCLRMVGVDSPAAVVFGAFAVERVLSLAVVSPAATGIVELGMTGFLVGLDAPAAGAAAGVLLYRIFVVGMEVPVGGVLLVPWAGRRLSNARRRRTRPGAAVRRRADLPPPPAAHRTQRDRDGGIGTPLVNQLPPRPHPTSAQDPARLGAVPAP